MELTTSSPLSVIALVSRVVTRVVDRITGDRSECPLFVAGATQLALRQHAIGSHVLYGKAAWIEVLEDHSVIWAGCLNDDRPYFWVETQFKEIVDLNAHVHTRKSEKLNPNIKAIYSPPLLWSSEIPAFYRYEAVGAAEIADLEEPHSRWWDRIQEEITQYCSPQNLVVAAGNEDIEFPNEPLIAPDRKLLDDTVLSFQQFDRALSVRGLPAPPHFHSSH